MKAKIGDHVREVANTTVELAKEGSPVDTGTNRKSITMDLFDSTGRLETVGEMPSAEDLPAVDGLGFRVYTQSGYGGWLEIGTNKPMAARPYIAPAFEKAVNELKRDLEGSI